MKNDSIGENPYGDIIGLPHHRSGKHTHMPLEDRAAQFSPFAALTGHDAAVKETARLTDRKIELDEGEKADLNDKLLIIVKRLDDEPCIAITYFLMDERKSGGAYVTETGIVKKIDEYGPHVVMRGGAVIPMDDILTIEGKIFDK